MGYRHKRFSRRSSSGSYFTDCKWCGERIHSYVIWFQYAGIKVVLGGDATEAVWQSIHKQYGNNLKCHVLKASHHGRDSGYHQPAVEAMSPQYTIVSVGKKPETDASDNYLQYSDHVWSTRWRGNIVLTIQPDGNANIESQYNREPPAAAEAIPGLPSYRSLPQ
jgi:competence protein ComEC